MNHEKGCRNGTKKIDRHRKRHEAAIADAVLVDERALTLGLAAAITMLLALLALRFAALLALLALRFAALFFVVTHRGDSLHLDLGNVLAALNGSLLLSIHPLSDIPSDLGKGYTTPRHTRCFPRAGWGLLQQRLFLRRNTDETERRIDNPRSSSELDRKAAVVPDAHDVAHTEL